MARKRRHQEPENHERWLVSYADFITLLFAFFVVMYAISSVNEGKYRVLTETLDEAFTQRLADRGGDPVGVETGGAIIAKPEPIVLSPESADQSAIDQQDKVSEQPEEGTTKEQEKKPEEAVEQIDPQAEQGESSPQNEQLAAVASDVKARLADLIDQNLADVVFNERWVEINLSSQMLFETGEARLNRPALKALRDLSRTLRKIPNAVNVEGYTDNVPIRTREYPSNWELSAARAASVVHYLSRLGVDPSHLAAVGFGEYRPRADNDSPEGRAKNRRISLLIMAAKADGEDRGSMRFAPGATP